MKVKKVLTVLLQWAFQLLLQLFLADTMFFFIIVGTCSEWRTNFNITNK